MQDPFMHAAIAATELISNVVTKKMDPEAKPRVFLSFSSQDAKIASILSGYLNKLEIIVINSHNLDIGTQYETATKELISSSDAFIILLTESHSASKWGKTECEYIFYESQRNPHKPVIVVRESFKDQPDLFKDRLALILDFDSLEEEASRIALSIRKSFARSKIEQESILQLRNNIKISSAEYVSNTLLKLEAREKMERRYSAVWQIFGVLILLLSLATSVWLAIEFSNLAINQQLSMGVLLFISVKGFVILAIAFIFVRYAVDISKSHMNEALKNADRIHAISFGEFYLRAFEEKTNWQELKEVFQHWNISQDSHFSKIDGKNYDPEFIAKMIEFSKIFSEKSK